MASVYDFSATTIDGHPQSLSEYRGQVLVIVNVASVCVLTPQYATLESLYQQYRDRGLVVLGFPCDQFFKQEYSDNAKIAEFCQRRYGVSFPMFARIDVNGPTAHPLFVFLRQAAPGFAGWNRIGWNFTKFLVDRTGQNVRRYAPQTSPRRLTAAIEGLL